MTEQWRPVVGASRYQVSSLGRVISNRRSRPRLLSLNALDGCGYPHVGIRFDHGRTITRTVHRLVAEAFLGPRPDGLVTRHLDGDPRNNRVANLMYGTQSENQLDAVRHGTHPKTRVLACPQDHPYDEVNTYLTPDGRRDCRACKAEYSRTKRKRQRTPTTPEPGLLRGSAAGHPSGEVTAA